MCWHTDGMIAQNDKMVGELLEKLEEFALTSNTLVICESSNGRLQPSHAVV